jgi:hypothetical protein
MTRTLIIDSDATAPGKARQAVEEPAGAWGVRDGSTHMWSELAVPED